MVIFYGKSFFLEIDLLIITSCSTLLTKESYVMHAHMKRQQTNSFPYFIIIKDEVS